MKENDIPFTVRQLDVNGDDIKKLGFKGEEIGKALDLLLTECIDGRLKNERAALINAAARLARGTV